MFNLFHFIVFNDMKISLKTRNSAIHQAGKTQIAREGIRHNNL